MRKYLANFITGCVIVVLGIAPICATEFKAAPNASSISGKRCGNANVIYIVRATGDQYHCVGNRWTLAPVTGTEITDDTITEADIADDAIEESHLKAVDAAADEECLTYETTTGDFEWQACAAADTDTLGPDGDKGDVTVGGTGTTLTIDADSVALTTDTTGNYVASITNGAGITGADGGSEGATLTIAATLGTSVDISDETNLTAGSYLTLTGDDIAADVELYTDVKCIYFEDPVAADDFNSIWTANGFAATITKIWCESDQTVNMDLQVDDGTPADVNGTDLVCDSTPAEDESMGGDATLADGDRLDLAITSVSGTPTWVSICWTYTVDD